jgi:hypothetical protein
VSLDTPNRIFLTLLRVSHSERVDCFKKNQLSPHFTPTQKGTVMDLILIIIIFLFLFGGLGGGYYGYSHYGAGGGIGILGVILIVIFVLFIFRRGRP